MVITMYMQPTRSHLHWPGCEGEAPQGRQGRAEVLHAWPVLPPVVQVVGQGVRQAVLHLIHAVPCQLVQVIRLTIQPAVH